MGSMTMGVDVAASADRVWPILCDLEGAEERIDDITKVEVLTEGPFGVGTRWRETRKMFGKESTEEMEVIAIDPGKSYTVTANSCGTLYETVMSVRPQGANACRVEFEFGWTPQSMVAKLMSPMAFMMKGMLRKCIEGDLNCIKRSAEGGGGPANAAVPA